MQNQAGTQRVRRSAVALVLLTALAAALDACEDSPAEPREREVLLGGLFSLSGNWSTLGQTSQAAVEIAIEDVNRYLEGNAARIRFRDAVEDTRLEPALALQKAQSLRGRGAQILIGPQSSAEVAFLKPYADANALLVVSRFRERRWS